MRKWCLLLAGFAMMGVGGCDDSTAVQAWVKKVEPLRTTAEGAMSAVPYQLAQHQAFKDYFSEIEQIAVRLVQDKDFAAAFNKAVAKVDLKNACARVFMERRAWQFIAENCTKNGLFICSEEVRVYPDLVAGIRKQLVPAEQRRFDMTPACQRAL